MRWWILVLFAGICVGCSAEPTWRAWDCHGAGFMQGCRQGQVVQLYYQSCERSSWWGQRQQGYRLVHDGVIRPGALVYDEQFDGDLAACAPPTTHEDMEEHHRRMQSIMGFPL